MKIFLWLVVVAFTIFCFGCWCFAFLVMQYIRDFRSVYLPSLTHIVLMPHTWLLFCPLPWLASAIALTVRRDPSQRAILIFAGTALVAAVIIFWAVALAAFVGAIPFKL